jgi:cation diffusion facilitator family transporter
LHTHDLAEWQHDHVFDTGNTAGERGARLVMWITAAMMVVEIAAGWFYNSMALLADGFHMSSHTVAIGLSAFAYAAARKHAKDSRFAFGTWKIEVLGGFASAIFLLVVVALMVYGSVERLLQPEPIHYREAIFIAVLGLAINLVSARILGAAHHHVHGHAHGDHDHDHAHGHHHDLNLKSAYIHVIADAATSVAAIVALAGGWWLGWSWLDPVMGIVGAIVVAFWAKGLIVDTGKVLLDRVVPAARPSSPICMCGGSARRPIPARSVSSPMTTSSRRRWCVAGCPCTMRSCIRRSRFTAARHPEPEHRRSRLL